MGNADTTGDCIRGATYSAGAKVENRHIRQVLIENRQARNFYFLFSTAG